METTEKLGAGGAWNGILARLSSIGVSPLNLVFLAILAIVPLFIKDEYILKLLVSSLLLGTQAMAFDFTTGFINIVNFGFAAFVGLGAYTSALLAVRLGVSPWMGIFVGAFAAGLLGFLTGILTLRLRGIFAAVMAWFVGITLLEITAGLTDLTRGTLGLNVPLFLETAENRPYFYILLPIAIATFVVLRMVTRSHIGLAFRAIGQNIEAARASGVNPTKYRVINFTLSCAFAGLLGGFWGHYIGILMPDIMHTKHTVEVLALAYIGGRGSIWGGLVAAFIFIPIFEYLKRLMEFRLIIYGVFLMLVMIFYPGGLADIYRRILQRIVRSTASAE
ncbi:MAG: branched-chain amino acid ABC transporter permease [Anaerolineae bacterium]